MFPLNWNLPFRKKDGSLVKLNDAMTADVDALKTRVETLEGTVGGNSRDIDSLETFTEALQDQINPDEYSEDEAYTAGDYVIHGNKLYKCNTSCSADTWENNSSYFTETSVADEFGAVADELADVDDKLNYSTTEQVVGKWIDGKLIYRRVFSGDYQLTSGTQFTIPNSVISNFSELINLHGRFLETTYGDYWQPITHANSANYNFNMQINYNDSGIGLRTNADAANIASMSKFAVIIEYTKTST